MKKLVTVFALISSCFYVKTSAAFTCTTLSHLTTFYFQSDITVQRDLPVGSPIGIPLVSQTLQPFQCTNTPDPSINYTEIGVKGYSNFVTTINGRRIYSTSIPGIGYAINGRFCNTTLWVDGKNTGDGNLNNKIICAVNGLSNLSGSLSFQLYKTAETTGTGTTANQKIGAMIIRLNQSSWRLDELSFYLAPVTIKSVTCSLNTSSLNIDMGKIDKKTFSGVGSYPGDSNTKNVDIQLNCDSGANVNLLVQGTTINASNGVLKLSSSAGAATGVGIQILNGTAPLPLNRTVSIKTNTSSGIYTIPLKARYYQTESSISSGSANATSTFTLTYN